MIKKIQIELYIFALLLLCVLLTNKIDIAFYNFFSGFNYGNYSSYFKDFFIKITNLGNSLWYFLSFILIFLFSYLAKKTKLISLDKYYYLKKLSFFGFAYLLVVGIITQLLKHIIGRPRPNHVTSSGGFEFNFFTTESAFHSFPSGHSSTIAAVIIIVTLTLPKLRYFFYFCGFLIALSRVVVGAHFLSDIFAGIVVAIITYKVFSLIIINKYPNIFWYNLEIKNISTLTNMVIVFSVLAVFTTIAPEIDVYLSSFFYYGGNQFLLQSYYLISIFFRKILLPLLLVYIFVLPIIGRFIPIEKIYYKHKFVLSELYFIWFSGIVTMLLIVNVLLKDMWGRARPNDISQFDGREEFSPWYMISNSCESNCSFISGDASVGFFLVVFYFITRQSFFLYLGVFMGAALGIIRVVAGGHFFSDIIFSQIIVTASIFMSFTIYKKFYDK